MTAPANNWLLESLQRLETEAASRNVHIESIRIVVTDLKYPDLFSFTNSDGRPTVVHVHGKLGGVVEHG